MRNKPLSQAATSLIVIERTFFIVDFRVFIYMGGRGAAGFTSPKRHGKLPLFNKALHKLHGNV